MASFPGAQQLLIAVRAMSQALGRVPTRFQAVFDGRWLSQLDGRLEVVRDRNGVAHIYADHETDAWAAVGLLQACERPLHLEALRHLARGRLAAWVGNVPLPKRQRRLTVTHLLDIDRFIRPLAFEAEALEGLARMAPRDRQILEAFARGIHDGLQHGPRPAEFALLPTPAPWSAVDCLLTARACAWVISLLPLENELAFDAVRASVGDDMARLVYPDAPWQHRPSVSDDEHPATLPPVPAAVRVPEGLGSNNWAVSGRRTRSGKPLLCNDPHVPLMPAPTFWHHVHVQAPGLDVQGGLYPGFPGFGYGHHRQLAWGVTTAFRDAWDLVRLKRVGTQGDRYESAQGLLPIDAHADTLGVRWGRPVRVAWERCAHGVIYPHWQTPGTDTLALKYVGCDHAAHLAGHLALMRAETVREIDAAIDALYAGPFDFNLVYASRAGRIGWDVIGQLPQRVRDGLFLRDARDPAAAWQDLLPAELRPRRINPADGVLVTANSVSDPHQHALIGTSVHCEPLTRQQRIRHQLLARDDHDVASMQALQLDVGSDVTPKVRDALVRLLSPYALTTPLQAEALRQLAAWDGRFDIESRGAAVYHLTRRLLTSLAFTRLVKGPAGRRFAHGSRGGERLERWLLNDQDALWNRLVDVSGYPLAHWAGVAFERSVRWLSKRLGSDVMQWQWGALQRIRLGSLLWDRTLRGGGALAVDAPCPGDINTVNPAVSVMTAEGLRVIVGASSRFVCDLATPEAAWFSHAGGPSFDPASIGYRSLATEWLAGRWFRSALWPADQIPGVRERSVVYPADLGTASGLGRRR